VSKEIIHEYLLPCEVGRLLRCSQRTLARMRAERSGPTFSKCGGRILYTKAAVDHWVAGNAVHSTADAA
jgi:hypothetical protein